MTWWTEIGPLVGQLKAYLSGYYKSKHVGWSWTSRLKKKITSLQEGKKVKTTRQQHRTSKMSLTFIRFKSFNGYYNRSVYVNKS